MNKLQQHIEAENAASKLRMEQEPGLYIGMVVSDPAHWAEYGVTTVEQYERYMLECFVYEYHKSVMGYKPHGLSEMTTEELNAEIAYIDRSAEHEREMEARHRREQSRIIQQRKRDNRYRPNRAMQMALSKAFILAS